MMSDNKKIPGLPARNDPKLITANSLLIAILLTAAALAVLLYQGDNYPSDESVHSFLPTDVANLLIGVPMLLLSIWLTRRGKLLGLLLWSGVLLFVLYSQLVYILALPLNLAYLLHLLLAVLCLYTLTGLLIIIDGEAVRFRLVNRVPERLAGGIMAGFGLLFFSMALINLVNALTGQADMSSSELALITTDFLIAPAWVIGGVLL